MPRQKGHENTFWISRNHVLDGLNFHTFKPGFFQAPNALRLVRERPNGPDAKRYRRIRQHQALYSAAARLWQQGLDMNQAIQIVTDAVMAVPT